MVNYLVIKYNKKYEIKCSKIKVGNIKCSYWISRSSVVD